MNRRNFVKYAGGTGLIRALPLQLPKQINETADTLQIGIVADVHQDIVPDGYDRVSDLCWIRCMEGVNFVEFVLVGEEGKQEVAIDKVMPSNVLLTLNKMSETVGA